MKFTILLLLLSSLEMAQGFQVVNVGRTIVATASPATATPEAPAKKPAKKEKLTKEAKELLDVIDGKTKGITKIVAQTAPSVRVAIPEEFGLQPGELTPGHLVAMLKALGFDLVLDTNTAADLTIMEEGTELLHRVQARVDDPKIAEENPWPLFTSCCPGWMNMVEKLDPTMEMKLAEQISTCKSPHMMYGTLMKEYSQELLGVPREEQYMCSVMPCVRKRGESDEAAFLREDGVRQVDNVITTEDLGTLCRLKGIDASKLEPLPFDSPFQTDKTGGEGSGAGQLFGATGGVMEAALRTVYKVVTGDDMARLEFEPARGLDGLKEASVSLLTEDGKGMDLDVKIAIVNGLGNAKKLVQAIKDGEAKYDFVEVMACPGGCIGGGGQPKSKDKEILDKRLAVTYNLDKTLPVRQSHENPVVAKLYEDFLGEYGGETAHDLLHVHPVYGRKMEPKQEEPKKEAPKKEKAEFQPRAI